MNSKKLLAQWGLKWNPFSPELPSDGLLSTAKIDHFAWRVEQLVQEGGFALVTGESGTGKSVAVRWSAQRLSALRDVVVGVIERPQSRAPTSIETRRYLRGQARAAQSVGGVQGTSRVLEKPRGLVADSSGAPGSRRPSR